MHWKSRTWILDSPNYATSPNSIPKTRHGIRLQSKLVCVGKCVQLLGVSTVSSPCVPLWFAGSCPGAPWSAVNRPAWCGFACLQSQQGSRGLPRCCCEPWWGCDCRHEKWCLKTRSNHQISGEKNTQDFRTYIIFFKLCWKINFIPGISSFADKLSDHLLLPGVLCLQLHEQGIRRQ